MSSRNNETSETPMAHDWSQWYYHKRHVVESVFSLVPRRGDEMDEIIQSRSEKIGETRQERWSRPGD